MGLSFNQRESRQEVDIPLLGLEPNSFTGVVRNMNASGVFIDTSQLVPEKTRIRFKLTDQDFAGIILAGEVVHTYDQNRNGRRGLGVKLSGLGDEALAHLLAYLKKQASPSELLSTQVAKKSLPQLSCQLFIGGRDIDTGIYGYSPDTSKFLTDYEKTMEALIRAKSGEPMENYRDYIRGSFCIGSSEHNHLAMEAAYKASRIFRHFPLRGRRAMMDKVRHLLHVYRDQMIDIMVSEGHARELAEWEYGGMCEAYAHDTLDYYHHCISKKISDTKDGASYVIRRADGVVAVSLPSNAPCSNSVIAGFALLAGNALVIKPPIKTPLSTLFLWKEIFHKAAQAYGAPDGLINLIVGDSKLFLDEWMQSKYINDIFFFGPSDLGLEIGKKAYACGKKPILELSGNDMMMIWKDADLKMSAQALKDGFLGSTQICMLPKKALIHEDIYDSFLEAFTKEVMTLKPGLPNEKGVYLSPVGKIKEFYEFLEDAISKGATLHCGSKQINYLGAEDKRGCFIQPTILLIDTLEKALTMRCVLEENFFPMLPLIKISSQSDDKDQEIFDQMIALFDNNDFGLRASVWASSEEYVTRFMDYAHNSGLLMINARHARFSKYLGTHGGVKKSGGPFGEMNYVWEKTSHAHGIYIGTKQN